jgi:Holliday junction DNA helicase RuvB
MSDTDATGDVLRVHTWGGYVGQEIVKSRLRIHIDAALRDDRALDHILLEAPPGYGKTSLAQIVAAEIGAECTVVKMPLKAKALASLIRRWTGGVLVLDEIHRGSRSQQEDLLPLIEEGFISGDNGRQIYIDPMTTIIACTTEPDKVIAPLRDRFPIKPRFSEYTDTEMGTIITGMGAMIGITFPRAAANHLGGACAGTPRQARDLVVAARDLQTTKPAAILAMCEIDEDGLTRDHMNYLRCVDACGGIGVGLNTIVTLMRLPDAYIREIESLLLRRDLLSLQRTGRELTNKGFAKVHPRNRKESA